MNWKLGSNGVNCWWKIVTISKLDGKTNEYIRGKMNAQDIILNDITRKKTYLVWSCRENGPNATTKNYDLLETWRKEKTRPSPEKLERWNIYSHEWKRSKIGRMEQSKAMEYGSRKASSDVLKPRNIYIDSNDLFMSAGRTRHVGETRFVSLGKFYCIITVMLMLVLNYSNWFVMQGMENAKFVAPFFHFFTMNLTAWLISVPRGWLVFSVYLSRIWLVGWLV